MKIRILLVSALLVAGCLPLNAQVVPSAAPQPDANGQVSQSSAKRQVSTSAPSGEPANTAFTAHPAYRTMAQFASEFGFGSDWASLHGDKYAVGVSLVREDSQSLMASLRVTNNSNEDVFIHAQNDFMIKDAAGNVADIGGFRNWNADVVDDSSLINGSATVVVPAMVSLPDRDAPTQGGGMLDATFSVNAPKLPITLQVRIGAEQFEFLFEAFKAPKGVCDWDDMGLNRWEPLAPENSGHEVAMLACLNAQFVPDSEMYPGGTVNNERLAIVGNNLVLTGECSNCPISPLHHTRRRFIHFTETANIRNLEAYGVSGVGGYLNVKCGSRTPCVIIDWGGYIERKDALVLGLFSGDSENKHTADIEDIVAYINILIAQHGGYGIIRRH